MCLLLVQVVSLDTRVFGYTCPVLPYWALGNHPNAVSLAVACFAGLLRELNDLENLHGVPRAAWVRETTPEALVCLYRGS